MKLKPEDPQLVKEAWVGVPLNKRIITTHVIGDRIYEGKSWDPMMDKMKDYKFTLPDFKYELPESKPWWMAEYMPDDEKWAANLQYVHLSDATNVAAVHILLGGELVAAYTPNLGDNRDMDFTTKPVRLCSDDVTFSPLRVQVYWANKPGVLPDMTMDDADVTNEDREIPLHGVNDEPLLLIASGGEIVLSRSREVKFKYVEQGRDLKI